MFVIQFEWFEDLFSVGILLSVEILLKVVISDAPASIAVDLNIRVAFLTYVTDFITVACW